MATDAPIEAAADGAGGDARLAGLRAEMAKAAGGKGVDAYIVPSEDPHMVSCLSISSAARGRPANHCFPRAKATRVEAGHPVQRPFLEQFLRGGSVIRTRNDARLLQTLALNP
jgi:hypothetical protein